MNVTIQPNHCTAAIDVQPNGANSDLIVLGFTEPNEGSHTTQGRVVLNHAHWQQVVDQLAAHGIIAANHVLVPF